MRSSALSRAVYLPMLHKDPPPPAPTFQSSLSLMPKMSLLQFTRNVLQKSLQITNMEPVQLKTAITFTTHTAEQNHATIMI